jgi:hypothetical protein
MSNREKFDVLPEIYTKHIVRVQNSKFWLLKLVVDTVTVGFQRVDVRSDEDNVSCIVSAMKIHCGRR